MEKKANLFRCCLYFLEDNQEEAKKNDNYTKLGRIENS